MLLWNWIAFFLRAFVAALFITYACSKLLNLAEFATTIRRHRLIPDSFSGIAAKVLSVVELALGLLFLFNFFPLIVGLAISILLVVFSGILLRARFTPGLGIQDCGCSGVNKKKTPIGKALFRNVLLISASVVIIAVVGMHRNISLSLSPLIEVILLLCVLAGMLCIRSGWFSSLLSMLNVETTSREGRTSAGIEGNRRSFIKWGIAGFIGLSTFLNMTSSVSAATIDICPSGESCDCGPSGRGGWSGDCEETYNCNGNWGNYVPITRFCVLYCCGSGNPCEYYRTVVGTYYCPSDGGC
jgi:uncharacterized membrane protein YphA (DoxX/SURF4 family)